MIKVHKVQQQFNYFIFVDSIDDEELKKEVQESLNHMVVTDSVITFNGSVGIIFDMNEDEDTFEWSAKLKKLLPLSLTARETCIAILAE